MLAELLLVLGGHPSALLTPKGVAPALAEHLHPGEVAALGTLTRLAGHYTAVRQWAEGTQAAARAAVLAGAKKNKGKGRADARPSTPTAGDDPGQYVAVLAGAVRGVLAEYDELLVSTEAEVLSRDVSVVQREPGGGGFVPLSLLVAKFDEWQAPMAALAALVSRIQEHRFPPGELMQHVSDCGATGHPFLRRMFSTLFDSLWHLFLGHLVIFLLDGVAAFPEDSTPAMPSLGLDAGADPPHRLYRLNADLVPANISAPTRESILYVGRVAATLKREGRALPKHLTDKARKDVLAAPFDGLDGAIQRARAEIGEWLWTHILTGPQVAEAIESFANYFLTRDADYALSVIREIARLRNDRLLLANPQSSSSVIRAHDLDLALLRASINTAAEADRTLEALSWNMPLGPLRPHSRPAADDGTLRGLFAPALLGTPLALTAAVSWPLDLFMTPPAVAAYADLHAYLYAIRDTHMRVLESWSALSGAQRRRRQFTGVHEGGAGSVREARVALARQAWGTVRAMLFFLDTLLGHFMADIIGVQHKRLLNELARAAPHVHNNLAATGAARNPRAVTPTPRAATPTPGHTASSVRSTSPSRGAAYLDFLTLRQMHARHLAFLREGLLIAERESAILVRDILDTCKRFAGLVERWGGDVLPELLADGDESEMVAERAKAVDEISETLHDLITDFFRLLLDLQAPSSASGGGAPSEASTSATGRSTTLSRASVSRARVTQIMHASRGASMAAVGLGGGGLNAAGKADGSATGANGGSGSGMSRLDGGEEIMARHVEQLLLRLDFNGVLTQWQEGRREGRDNDDVLPPRASLGEESRPSEPTSEPKDGEVE